MRRSVISQVTQVAVTPAGVTVLARRDVRASAVLYNSGPDTAKILLGTAPVAATKWSVPLPMGAFVDICNLDGGETVWTGVVTAITEAGESATLQVTEME
jgi:hypothetical protein